MFGQYDPNDPDAAISMISTISVKTGLGNQTVQDLLTHGWMFEMEINQPYKFVKRGIS